MEKEYICSIAKFNVVVSPYLSSIFGNREVDQKNNKIFYRPNEDQNSGTRAVVAPIIEIKGNCEFKLVDKISIKLIHQEKVKELEALIN